jgi:hypothetical protein
MYKIKTEIFLANFAKPNHQYTSDELRYCKYTIEQNCSEKIYIDITLKSILELVDKYPSIFKFENDKLICNIPEKFIQYANSKLPTNILTALKNMLS